MTKCIFCSAASYSAPFRSAAIQVSIFAPQMLLLPNGPILSRFILLQSI